MVIDRGRASVSESRSRRWFFWPVVVLAMFGVSVLVAVAAAGFDDDAGSVHEPAIDALAERGVFAGTECGQDLICPDGEIPRWVMAVWLV